MNEPMRVELDVDAKGHGTIKVDGHDLSNKIFRVEIDAASGELTRVTLYARAAQVKVMASSWVEYKCLTLDPDTAKETDSYP